MASNFIQVPPNSTGLKIDTNELTVGANTVERENVSIADPVTAANVANVTAGGALKVDATATTQPVSGAFFQATQPVSGTVTADIVGHAGATLDGTAGSPSTGVVTVQGVSGGTVVPVSLTSTTITGTVAATQSTSPWVDNLTQVASTALGATAIVNYGSAPAAVAVPAVNAFITNTPTVVQGTAAAVAAGWPITGGTLAEATAAWTSATGSNTSLQVNTAGYSTVVVTLNEGSTITGGVVTFEVSDTTAFTNAYAIQVLQNLGVAASPSAVASYTLVATTNISFKADVAGWAAFRVRLSTVIAGTATVNVGITASAMASDPIVFAPGTVLATGGNTIGKVDILGNSSGILDAVITAAAAPANGLATLVVNQTTAPSLTTGQSVATQGDYVGSLFVKPYRRSQTVAKATTISATGATSVLAAQAAGIFADISTLIITVTDQATTASAFTATLSDGTASYIFDLEAPVTPALPTIMSLQFDPPLPATTAATAWTVNISVTNTIHVTVVAVLQKAS